MTAFVASDSEVARNTVLELAKAIGFDPVDAGPLTNARSLEAMAALNIPSSVECWGTDQTSAPNSWSAKDLSHLMEKDSKRFPDSGGWGYALFNYDLATDKFTADASPANCGHVCHVAVKSKDYIFHPYQKR